MEKKVVIIHYVAADHLYEIEWSRLSGKSLCMTEFWDHQLLLISQTNTPEELKQYYEQLKELILQDENEVWEANRTNDDDWDTFQFEFDDVIIRVTPEGIEETVDLSDL
ncbi:hypothetical protein D3C71_448740 [compost metagenome]